MTKPTTPINVAVLKLYLTGYDPITAAKLVDGFSSGFSTGYQGTINCEAKRNAGIIQQYMQETKNKIATEIQLGRIKGPFSEKPFENMHISPISVRPKKDGSVRLLHNLSFPYDMSSVNKCIPKSDTYVTYATVSDAIAVIQKLGPGCHLAKSDIKAAFRLLPIKLEEHPLLGFKFEGQYYYDTCMAIFRDVFPVGYFIRSVMVDSQMWLAFRRIQHVFVEFLIVDGW